MRYRDTVWGPGSTGGIGESNLCGISDYSMWRISIVRDSIIQSRATLLYGSILGTYDTLMNPNIDQKLFDFRFIGSCLQLELWIRLPTGHIFVEMHFIELVQFYFRFITNVALLLLLETPSVKIVSTFLKWDRQYRPFQQLKKSGDSIAAESTRISSNHIQRQKEEKDKKFAPVLLPFQYPPKPLFFHMRWTCWNRIRTFAYRLKRLSQRIKLIRMLNARRRFAFYDNHKSLPN